MMRQACIKPVYPIQNANWPVRLQLKAGYVSLGLDKIIFEMKITVKVQNRLTH